MKKMLSVILCICLIFVSSTVGISAVAVTEENITTIIACSDVQSPNGASGSKQQISNIVNAMIADGLTDTDALFCSGDYDKFSINNAYNTQAGINALTEATSPLSPEHKVLIKGNHDTVNGVNGICMSGNNDPESGAYGVFAINESDYMWYGNDETTIKNTAQSLINYLNEKINADFNKPIFVLSHLPLHFTMRTYYDGDGRYARYIFDALNNAGKKGLNIYFLYGHDHSNGWDDYLGGSTVYLKKGDSINVAEYSKTTFKTHTLAFTYMNPGFVGYYDNHNGADDTLTMSKIVISGNDVTVTRYSADGVHTLKSEGKRNTYKGETIYDPNTTVYSSPQVNVLTEINDYTTMPDLISSGNSNEPSYTKIGNLSQLKDGGKYLLIYENQIMLPKSVTKANSSGSQRTGFDLESNGSFTTNVVYGEYADKEWTFTKSGDKWYLGNGTEFVKLNATSDRGIEAVFAETGDEFTISGSVNAFNFSTDSYVFNYNSRGLINGYASSPAAFNIYESTGIVDDSSAYKVTVIKGEAQNESGEVITKADIGDTVTITANSIKGKSFSKWVIIEGDAQLKNASRWSTSLTVTGDVKLIASYVDTVKGDINSDTIISSLDLLMLQMHILSVSLADDVEACDFDGDGEVTSADLVILQSYIIGLNETI